MLILLLNRYYGRLLFIWKRFISACLLANSVDISQQEPPLHGGALEVGLKHSGEEGGGT